MIGRSKQNLDELEQMLKNFNQVKGVKHQLVMTEDGLWYLAEENPLLVDTVAVPLRVLKQNIYKATERQRKINDTRNKK